MLLAYSLNRSAVALEKERSETMVFQSIDCFFAHFSEGCGNLASSFGSSSRGEEFLGKAKAHMKIARQQLTIGRDLTLDDPVMQRLWNLLQSQAFVYFDELAQKAPTNSHKVTSVDAKFFSQYRTFFRMAASCNNIILQLSERQQEQLNLSIAARKNSHRYIVSLVALATLVNLVSGVSAVLLFRSTILLRLRMLIEKAQRLKNLQDLGAKMSGRDEFNELDGTLHSAYEGLHDAQEFRKEMNAMVAHDLRAPLASMSVSAQLLSSELKESEGGEKRVSSIDKTIVRLLRLIDDFLDLEKLEAGKIVLEKEQTSVTDLVDDCFGSISDLALLKSLTLKFEGDDRLIYCDRQKILQVLINLMGNAIKFSLENETILCSVKKQPGAIEFSIADRGTGLSEESRQTLFSKFSATTPTKIASGFGLGLFISKRFVDAHGGTIWCERNGNQGTIFSFSLPQKEGS